MIHCRETCSQRLANMGRGSSAKYLYASKSPSPPAKSTPTKRRRVVEDMQPKPASPPASEEDEDNIYEGISRLYEETPWSSSCASEAREETVPAAAMQAIVI